MQGKVHVAIGVATTCLMCVKYPTGFDAFGIHILPEIALLTAAAGSYAPDIDSSMTHSGRRHKVVSKVVSKVGGGHRGITHTLLVPVILAVLVALTGIYVSKYSNIATVLGSIIFGLEVGWVMHIFADLFNGKGCPILWPLMKGKVHIMDLPSSGFIPWAFATILVAIMGFVTFGGILEWF